MCVGGGVIAALVECWALFSSLPLITLILCVSPGPSHSPGIQEVIDQTPFPLENHSPPSLSQKVFIKQQPPPPPVTRLLLFCPSLSAVELGP